MQKRLFDIGWSDESKGQACHKEEGTEKHWLYHCPEWHEVRREIPDAFRKWEQRTRASKKEGKWQKSIVTHPISESQWNRGHSSMKRWESEKHKKWGMPAEGFKGQVAIEGSPLGTAGKWEACGWSVAQLDYDEEFGPLHGMYGSMDAELEVQRTIKRAELTAFLCLLKAGDSDLWIKIWEELHLLTLKEILVEVEHVKAHRTEKDKKEMSQIEKFVAEGSEKADELANEGALLDAAGGPEAMLAMKAAKDRKEEFL